MPAAAPDFRLGFWIAVGLAIFSILFGTRNIHAREQHHGVVAAIALEAIVKLVALLAVGILVVYGMAGGAAQIFARAEPGTSKTCPKTWLNFTRSVGMPRRARTSPSAAPAPGRGR